WSIVNDHGAYLNRNIPEEAHMYFGYFSAVYGRVRLIAFDADGDGWTVLSTVTPDQPVCGSTQCVSVRRFYEHLTTWLDDKVVGYACAVGGPVMSTYSHGLARSHADEPARPFLPSTKIGVASVSKMVTALAAIRVLAEHQVSLDSGIGQYLPKDWDLDSHVASITFRQLLSHHSGIKDYGNVEQSYSTLKTFFTQHVDPTKNTSCQGSAVNAVVDPINPNATDNAKSCYSNYNFAIFRILLPFVAGFDDDPLDRPARLAARYVELTQQHVFEPVGAHDVKPRPPTSGPQAYGYAFSYRFPGNTPGHDWGDHTLEAGAVGWYLSIEDIAKVLRSLNDGDGRILTPSQLSEMESCSLGWDTVTAEPWVEKNGGWSAAGTTISTSVALFGPGLFGALFMDSDFCPPHHQSDWHYCRQCQALVFAGSTSPGVCAAGGQHRLGGTNYLVPTIASDVAGQQNWRWCRKCQELAFGGSSSPGQCPAGGQHDHSGSGDYVLAKAGGTSSVSQSNWRWCNKCQAMTFAGVEELGPCSAGGQHDHAGSGNYSLEYSPSADAVLRETYREVATLVALQTDHTPDA
ncbi:MAG: serine hydrolase, partial [Humibacillus sp.]|nr:serine hydrolase [Humibacillus sp.]MDN5779235.1 serine hydrolase [Humibacillus sp.]